MGNTPALIHQPSGSHQSSPTTPFSTTSTFTMADSNQPSTLQSYVESATGKVQSALGNVTGNTGDQAKGDLREEKAQSEYDASHATAKLPGATVSGSGAAVTDDKDRTDGSWNQTAGSAKETLGGLMGNENLKQAGRQRLWDFRSRTGCRWQCRRWTDW